MNYELLKSVVDASGLKRKYIAEKMGICVPTLSLKLTGRSPMTVDNLKALQSICGFSDETRDRIFNA